jgi:hypothetical protein
MAVTFSYPTSAELIQIAQDKMPRLIQDRPCFKVLPVQTVDADQLLWEQLDNYQGLQQYRGLNGAPKKIKKTGVSRYSMEPGYYGEYDEIDEAELTKRRGMGTFGTPVDLTDLVMMSQDKLLQRRLDVIEYIIWTLVTTGTFAIPGIGGKTMHTDTFTLQTQAASATLVSYTTATPLLDFRNVQLKHRGHSVNFGSGATCYVNRVTANQMMNNLNPADLYGRRTEGLGTYNTMALINALYAGDDLPQVVIYDDGYLADGTDGVNAAGTFVPYIAAGTGVVIGQRPAGQTVGEFRMTRNVNNPDAGPGAYMRVIDKGETQVPRSVEVHDGFNGGPVIFFPSAICIITGW